MYYVFSNEKKVNYKKPKIFKIIIKENKKHYVDYFKYTVFINLCNKMKSKF